jgi:hypothetical protein
MFASVLLIQFLRSSYQGSIPRAGLTVSNGIGGLLSERRQGMMTFQPGKLWFPCQIFLRIGFQGLGGAFVG